MLAARFLQGLSLPTPWSAPLSRRWARHLVCRGQTFKHSCQRGDAGLTICGLCELCWGVRDPGWVSHEQHRCRESLGCEYTGVVAGAGIDDRHTAEMVGEGCGQGRIKLSAGGVNDSSTARVSRASATMSTSRLAAASSGPRLSSQPVTWEAMALTALGWMRTLPTVARHPVASAALRARRINLANDRVGSRRSFRRVVPAWFASPTKSNLQRPCGQIAPATATAEPASLR